MDWKIISLFIIIGLLLVGVYTFIFSIMKRDQYPKLPAGQNFYGFDGRVCWRADGSLAGIYDPFTNKIRPATIQDKLGYGDCY